MAEHTKLGHGSFRKSEINMKKNGLEDLGSKLLFRGKPYGHIIPQQKLIKVLIPQLNPRIYENIKEKMIQKSFKDPKTDPLDLENHNELNENLKNQ